MVEEVWKPIPISKHYEVSNLGRIKSLDKKIYYKDGRFCIKTGKILKCAPHSKGYLRVNIEGKNNFIHRLVAITFLENPNNLEQVNHKNGDRKDNRIENLEWISNTDNQIHSWSILNRQPSLGKSKIVLNFETGIFYTSAKEAADSIGIKDWQLRLSINNKSSLKTSFKFI